MHIEFQFHAKKFELRVSLMVIDVFLNVFKKYGENDFFCIQKQSTCIQWKY